MPEELVTLIAAMREEEALALARKLLSSGTPPGQILDACRAAMAIVGQRFEGGEYFIPELVLAGEMLKSISAEVRPHLQGSHEEKKGARVIVGTVQGDIHDIGKNIVAFMLDVNGFEVLDLGVDVPVETFVARITDFRPAVVALSGLLTLAHHAMKETIDGITAAGLRNSVKIMIGGGSTDEQVRKYAGADAYGPDAMAAVSLARQFSGGE
jgi:trimethylamine corrinoid protein